MCIRSLCVCKLLNWLKLLSHSEHLYGLSPVCTLMWMVRLLLWLNALSHRWHLYGFSPLWILLCLLRSPATENRFPQTEHSNGFSPEWNRLCSVNVWRLWQLFPHSLHLYLLLWIFICCFMYCWLEKHFSHSVHEYIFLACVSLCAFKSRFTAYRLSRTVHTYGLGLSASGRLKASYSVCWGKQFSPAQREITGHCTLTLTTEYQIVSLQILIYFATLL